MLSGGALLRHVPGDSPVHRMWAGTKVAALGVLGSVVAVEPTWGVEAATAAVLVTAGLAARARAAWLPRPPRWLVVLTLLPVVVGALRGGAPYLHVGGLTVGVGGLLTMVRGTGVALLFLLAALLLTATTRTAELGPALSTLLHPLRRLRLPVDDVVLVTGLSVRCLPLLLDELTTTYAAWRLRLPPEERRRVRAWTRLVVTVVVSSGRRARELAEAVQNRGGATVPPPRRPRLAVVDAVAALLVAAVVAVAAAGL